MTIRNEDGSVCDCASNLTESQFAFLYLHVRKVVDRWQSHFGGATLRAHAGTHRATISSHELAALVDSGLVRRGGGEAVYPTKTAKELFA